ncbi:hypothetical protein GCM10009744_17620 [Kribbella alba]|uniref:Lipoprotein n=1 Tax=Kribbella alba TaxID=190197 RepID=A0ABN2F485_9ACTN
MSRSLAKVVGAALASVLVLAGCAAGTHPGAAAVVGNTEITVGDLDQTTRAVSTALGQPFTSGATLSNLVNSALVQQITEQRSIKISDAETAAGMKAVVSDQATYDKLVNDPVANNFLRGVAQAVIGTIKLGGGTGVTDPNAQQAQQAGQGVIKDASKNIRVDIAPRFGKWTDGTIDGKASGSLSDLSPQSQASQAATSQQTPQPQPQG